jgi:hypothetical protein
MILVDSERVLFRQAAGRVFPDTLGLQWSRDEGSICGNAKLIFCGRTQCVLAKYVQWSARAAMRLTSHVEPTVL